MGIEGPLILSPRLADGKLVDNWWDEKMSYATLAVFINGIPKWHGGSLIITVGATETEVPNDALKIIAILDNTAVAVTYKTDVQWEGDDE